MSLTEEDNFIIAICGTVSGTLSLLGSLSIICMYTHQRIRKQTLFYQKLVFYLSCSDLFWNLTTTTNQVYFIVNGTYEYPNQAECTASGFVQQWFEVACDFWIAIMSIYMYLRIVRKLEIEDKEYLFHLLSWGIPFVIALLPLFHVISSYNFTGAWCWVANTTARIYFSYVFAWTTFLIIIVSYALIIKYIRFVQKDVSEIDTTNNQNRSYKRLFRKMSAYPIIFLIQWIPASVNRIQNIAQPNNPIAALYIAHIIAVNSSGFLNGLLYGGIIYKNVFSKYERVTD